MEKVKLTIDGQEVTANKGELLIEVAEMYGTYLPRFCHFRGLTPQASCRMCVVRVEKMLKLQTACTVPAAEGMIVTTASDEIEQTRAAMIEFLLSNHPVDCPVCDRAGECELQDQTFGFGEDRTRSQFNDKEPTLERQISPFIYNDPQRCVTCKRCTRVCEEWMDEFAITTVNRGSHTLISSFGGWVECSDCGNCVDVCPTGTLLHVPYKYIARPWDLKQTPTICNFCSDGCSILAGTRSEELIRAVARDGRGRTAGGINHDFLCSLGRYTIDFVHSPERIDRPLIRRGDVLVPTTWDDALSYAARSLERLKGSRGGDAIGIVSAPRLLNEDQYLLAKLAEVIGTPHTDFFHETDEVDLASFMRYGTPPLATQKGIQEAEVVLLIGSDPNEENPLTAFSIRWAVRQNSARLFIVNSMPTRLERQAELALRVRPGSEGALIAGLLDESEIERASSLMAVALADLRRIREAVRDSRHVVVVFGNEISGASLAALSLLEEMLPAPDEERASEARRAHLDMLARQVRSTNSTNKPAVNDNPLTAIVPLPTLEVDREAPQPAPRFSFLPLVRASNTLGAVHMGMTTRRSGGLSAQAMINAAGERIAGLYVAGQDLLIETMDDREAVKSRLASLDVLIVQDMFLTETASLAHVVFPSTSFAESQGTQVNNGGQVQMVRRTIPPVGQARADWMITNSIARLLGDDFGFQGQLKQIFKEISERVEGYQGLSHSRLVNEGPQQVASRNVALTSNEREELLARLRKELESLPATGEVDTAELTAKAGSRLQQRYPAITRYSKMLTAAALTGEEARKPVVFPA